MASPVIRAELELIGEEEHSSATRDRGNCVWAPLTGRRDGTRDPEDRWEVRGRTGPGRRVRCAETSMCPNAFVWSSKRVKSCNMLQVVKSFWKTMTYAWQCMCVCLHIWL